LHARARQRREHAENEHCRSRSHRLSSVDDSRETSWWCAFTIGLAGSSRIRQVLKSPSSHQ
jgi:hypothetical protein